MAGGPLNDVLDYLRRVVGVRRDVAVSDGQLLERFAHTHDEEAFAALVQRHGRMVLGVCRQFLYDPNDVEDAFQATFLVLARKALSIRKRDLVANWLYGVAYRVAARARAVTARRRAHERQCVEMVADKPFNEESGQELRPALQEELNRLPAKYRMPVVLCYLEGKTNEEAAQQLGWPIGTVSGRLARARDMLRKRLARRGLTLSSAALVALLTPSGVSGLPATLVTSTVQAAKVFIGGQVGVGLISAPAKTLAEGALKAMFVTKMKTAAVVLTLNAIIASGGFLVFQTLAAEPAQAPKEEESKPAAKKADAPKVQTLATERTTFKGHINMVWAAAFSPDGKTLATVGGLYNEAGELKIWDLATRHQLADQTEAKGIRSVAFSPDGKSLATADYYDNTVKLRDPRTGQVRLVLPQGAANNAVAFSPDSKTLAVAVLRANAAKLWDVATGKELITFAGHQDWVPHVAFSPDGMTLATGSSDQTAKLWDVATGKERVTLRGHAGIIEFVAFSPDGHTLATASWDKTIKLWEVATGKERATLSGHSQQVLSATFSPDSRLLASTSGEANSPIAATSDKTGEVKLWDLAGRKDLGSLEGHSFRVWLVAFSPDGKSLATAAEDKTVKLWELAPPKQAAAKGISDQELEDLGNALQGADAPRAYQAVWKLVGAAPQAVPFLKNHLQPSRQVEVPEQKQLAQLIADLDSDDFAVREKASGKLEKLGLSAEPILRKALDDQPSAEMRRRIQQLLQKLGGPITSPETLRAIRSVEILELIGNPEARQVLEKLAKGNPDHRLTHEAKGALERLARQVATRQ